jgi:DNA repair exonuclease SbcCD ATPase subunit
MNPQNRNSDIPASGNFSTRLSLAPKIVFTKLTLRNFLSFGNTPTEYVFSDGGERVLIRGSNGSGKTSILDALCFSLYGKPYRNVSLPAVVNSINKKDCECSVEFNRGGVSYRIERGISPSKFSIYRDGILIPQDAAKKDYQGMLERDILQMNIKSFKQIVILGSSFVPFLRLTPAERRVVIEDILDISILSKMSEYLKEDMKANQNELRALEVEISAAKRHISVLKEELKNSLSYEEGLVERITGEIEDDLRELGELESQLQEHIAAYNAKCEEAATMGLPTIGLRRDFFEKVDAEIVSLCETKGALESDIEEGASTIRSIEHNVDCICPTCHQKLTKETVEKIVVPIQQRIFANTQKLNSITNDLLRKKQEKLEYQRVFQKLDEIASAGAGVRTRINVMTPVIEKKILELERIKKEKSSTDSSDVSRLRSSAIVDNIKFQGEELSSLEKRLEKGLAKQKILDGAASALKDTGIKAAILSEYIPLVNSLMTQKLNEFNFPVSFTLDSTFSEKIKARYRDEYTFDSFSEGEKARITVSMLLTWREIARLRNSVSTNLLFLDEVFDGSLDYDGSDDLLRILKMIEGKTNVYVISHKGESIVNHFDQVLFVKKNGNFSSLERA